MYETNHSKTGMIIAMIIISCLFGLIFGLIAFWFSPQIESKARQPDGGPPIVLGGDGKPHERYFRGDYVKLVNGLEASIYDKRNGGWNEHNITTTWHYKGHVLSGGFQHDIEFVEPEVVSVLRESPGRPVEFRSGPRPAEKQ